jgi:hypothetical protein
MPAMQGERIPLSLPRRWMADLMAVSHGVPRVACVRRLCFADAVAARIRARRPASWTAMFAKAMGIVAVRRPELRRAYVSFPWPHFYQSTENFFTISVARDYFGEPAVFFGHLRSPERLTLPRLAEEFDLWKTAPVEEVRPFARLIRYSKMPWFIRRTAWRLAMSLSGRHRAKTFGTIGITTLGGANASIIQILAPTALTLSFGPIDDHGFAEVQLNFDHRVLDGLSAVQALGELEAAVNGPIAIELVETASLAA